MHNHFFPIIFFRIVSGKNLIVSKKSSQLAKLLFLKSKTAMKARRVPFELMKISGKKEKNLKKFFHYHQ